MQYELAELARRFGTPAPQPHHEPPLPDCEGPMVLSGIASDYQVDGQHMRFRKYALSWLPWKLPPLRFRHGPDIVGTVDYLEHTDQGLRVRVTTDHFLAKLCGAFSVAGTIYRYRMEDVDSPNYHAVIEAGWLDEISLTMTPCNARALVYERAPVPPHVEYYRALSERFVRMRQMVQTELIA